MTRSDASAVARGRSDRWAEGAGHVLGGRYRVLRELGTGGMGTVYLAEHVHLGRLTAVKVLCPPQCDGDPSAVQRFRQEALLVAGVRHPGVAQVYDFDRGPDGQFLLAMEYVEGETVAQRLERDGPFPLQEAIRVLRSVADALNHVHWMGILHRDLKPQNIMLSPGGVVKLLDFGVAHEMARLLGTDGLQPGTLAYMSPDQLLGDEIGPASDIYSLGVVVYEMLTGRLPHAGTTVAELRLQRLLRPPIPVHWLRPICPRELAEVVARALHPEPAERWPSAVAFAQAAARAVTAGS
ncbi:MAG TPA: serine/threonine-protein kinase [Gemmatimonadales bacterium]|nr:serine/threonine-protein kinase [Gemmatimonadales bacterium]